MTRPFQSPSRESGRSAAQKTGRFILLPPARRSHFPSTETPDQWVCAFPRTYPAGSGKCIPFLNMKAASCRSGQEIFTGRRCLCRIMRTTCRGRGTIPITFQPTTPSRSASFGGIFPGAPGSGAGNTAPSPLQLPISTSTSCSTGSVRIHRRTGSIRSKSLKPAFSIPA